MNGNPQDSRQTETSLLVASQGPIPDARALEAYRRIRKDLPDIIIQQWLDESSHRRKIEEEQISIQKKEMDIKQETLRGVNYREWAKLGFGVLFAFLALYFAWTLLQHGKTNEAIFVVVVPVIISLFNGLFSMFRK